MATKKVSMLTTIDNPWSPFTHFTEWFAYDTQHGYHTSAFLARVVRSSYDLSQADQDLAIDQAIDEIVRLNLLGIYKKISKEIEVA